MCSRPEGSEVRFAPAHQRFVGTVGRLLVAEAAGNYQGFVLAYELHITLYRIMLLLVCCASSREHERVCAGHIKQCALKARNLLDMDMVAREGMGGLSWIVQLGLRVE